MHRYLQDEFDDDTIEDFQKKKKVLGNDTFPFMDVNDLDKFEKYFREKSEQDDEFNKTYNEYLQRAPQAYNATFFDTLYWMIFDLDKIGPVSSSVPFNSSIPYSKVKCGTDGVNKDTSDEGQNVTSRTSEKTSWCYPVEVTVYGLFVHGKVSK